MGKMYQQAIFDLDIGEKVQHVIKNNCFTVAEGENYFTWVKLITIVFYMGQVV